MDLGMIDEIYKQIKAGNNTCLKDLAGQTDRILEITDLVKAAKDGDELAIKVIEDKGYSLGKKVAFLVNLLNPEVVIIGGGVEICGAILLDAVKEAIKDWAIEETAQAVKVIPSAFGENAIALGVVGIVVREIFTQA